MSTRRPRIPTTNMPAPAITSRVPMVSQPLPAPVDGVEGIPWTPLDGVGVAVAPPTPPDGEGEGVAVGVAVGVGLGVGPLSQPSNRMKPDARVARLSSPVPNGAQTS